MARGERTRAASHNSDREFGYRLTKQCSAAWVTRVLGAFWAVTNMLDDQGDHG